MKNVLLKLAMTAAEAFVLTLGVCAGIKVAIWLFAA